MSVTRWPPKLSTTWNPVRSNPISLRRRLTVFLFELDFKFQLALCCERDRFLVLKLVLGSYSFLLRSDALEEDRIEAHAACRLVGRILPQSGGYLCKPPV
ncbi:hypothetical protein VTN77DRAFT_4939 [Rasamsonia byssochlamydoides]|uniref:uncharacterized protein n=1 Tax=Rasamsonia byssochlamydoides TaxID=89139 RepID=UPI003743EF00